MEMEVSIGFLTYPDNVRHADLAVFKALYG